MDDIALTKPRDQRMGWDFREKCFKDLWIIKLEADGGSNCPPIRDHPDRLAMIQKGWRLEAEKGKGKTYKGKEDYPKGKGKKRTWSESQEEYTRSNEAPRERRNYQERDFSEWHGWIDYGSQRTSWSSSSSTWREPWVQDEPTAHTWKSYAWSSRNTGSSSYRS